jgi:hypothetical protein
VPRQENLPLRLSSSTSHTIVKTKKKNTHKWLLLLQEKWEDADNNKYQQKCANKDLLTTSRKDFHSVKNQEKQRALAPGEGTRRCCEMPAWVKTNRDLAAATDALFLLHSPFPFPSPVIFISASQQPSRPAPATTWESSSALAAITDLQPLNHREQVLAVAAAQQCDQLHPGWRHPSSSSPSTSLVSVPGKLFSFLCMHNLIHSVTVHVKFNSLFWPTVSLGLARPVQLGSFS